MAAPRALTKEHKDALIKNRLTLVNDITEPTLLGILNYMYSKSAITGREYEYIKSKKVKHDMNEEFLDVLAGKTDAAFGVFLEALMEEGLHHIVRKLQGGLVPGPGVEGGDMPGAMMMMSNHHKHMLRINRVTLTDDMSEADTRSILNILQQEDVFTQRDCDTVRAERTSYAKAEKLLDLLPGKGENAYESFRYALNECGQEHLASLLQDEPLTHGHPVQAMDQSMGQPYGQQYMPQYGQPQYGQPQYGQPQYGQPQYGQPQYGQPQYGQPHGQPYSGPYQQFQ